MSSAKGLVSTVLAVVSIVVIYLVAPAVFITLDLSPLGRLGWPGYALLGAGLGAAVGMLAARRRYRLHGNVAAGAGGVTIVMGALIYLGNPVTAADWRIPESSESLATPADSTAYESADSISQSTYDTLDEASTEQIETTTEGVGFAADSVSEAAGKADDLALNGAADSAVVSPDADADAAADPTQQLIDGVSMQGGQVGYQSADQRQGLPSNALILCKAAIDAFYADAHENPFSLSERFGTTVEYNGEKLSQSDAWRLIEEDIQTSQADYPGLARRRAANGPVGIAPGPSAGTTLVSFTEVWIANGKFVKSLNVTTLLDPQYRIISLSNGQ